MFELIDDFNNQVISRHRTLQSVAKAKSKHNRAIKKYNGSNSYIPYIVKENGKLLSESQEIELQYIEHNLI